MARQSRAVSPIISTVLIVAITVILAATISVLVLDLGENVQNPGPNVAQSSGEFVGHEVGMGYNSQIVRITHIAGDSVDVEEIEVAVQACGKTGRIINLPADYSYAKYSEDNFAAEDSDDSIFSQGSNAADWETGVFDASTDNTFRAGSWFQFRIVSSPNNGGCQLETGDEVTVRVVHTPTNSVIIKQILTASDS